MSLLQLLACEGCGATAEPDVVPGLAPRAPFDWLTISGPASDDEITKSPTAAPKRHVCSPACLATLAERLAGLKGRAPKAPRGPGWWQASDGRYPPAPAPTGRRHRHSREHRHHHSRQPTTRLRRSHLSGHGRRDASL